MGFLIIFDAYVLPTLVLLFSTAGTTSLSTDNGVVSTDFKSSAVSFTSMEPVRVLMYGQKTVTVFYAIPCVGDERLVTIRMVSQDMNVFTVLGNQTIVVPCQKITDIAVNGTVVRDQTIGVSETSASIIDDARAFSKTENPMLVDFKFSNENSTGNQSTSAYPVSHINVTIDGLLIGISKLLFVVETGDATTNIANTVREGGTSIGTRNGSMTVFVLRQLRPVDRIFQYFMAGMIIILTMAFGCKLDLGIVKECIKKPVAPAIGVVCQYILMPMIGFTVTQVVPINDSTVLFGLFVCSTCPGGGISNIYSYLLDGDVSLSITMTFISTILSIAMMPLWIYTLGRTYLNEDFTIVIPYVNMLQVIATITIPLSIGILIKWKSAKTAVFIMKVMKPFTVVCVIATMCLGIYSFWPIFRLIHPVYFIPGCMLPYFGYLIGGAVAAIFRLPRDRILTVAIETGIQNQGIALLVLITSFPPPQGDLAAIAPMATSLMTPQPLFIAFIVYTIYKKCCKKYEPANVEEPKAIVIQNGKGEKKLKPRQPEAVNTNDTCEKERLTSV